MPYHKGYIWNSNTRRIWIIQILCSSLAAYLFSSSTADERQHKDNITQHKDTTIHRSIMSLRKKGRIVEENNVTSLRGSQVKHRRCVLTGVYELGKEDDSLVKTHFAPSANQ